MKLLIESLFCYHTVTDSPLSGFAAREMFQTDVITLHLREVEEDKEEPRYVCFGDDPKLKLTTLCEDKEGGYKVSCNCENC